MNELKRMWKNSWHSAAIFLSWAGCRSDEYISQEFNLKAE
jgi:hypothetical protein